MLRCSTSRWSCKHGTHGVTRLGVAKVRVDDASAYMAPQGCSRGWWSRGELKAGMLRCDWVEIAALPQRLSIVVAFRNGWVNTGARVGPSKLDELVTGS